LFAARARQVRPDFEPDSQVGEICERLDRLPLAIELASTRVKVMTTAQILARLEHRFGLLTGGWRDAPPRQWTMKAAIDWSYDLLSAGEQRAFRALGVFAGSFELEAAEAVCSADVGQLQSLVDKSLLRLAENGRFFMMETTREYALSQLRDTNELADMRRRHAQWFYRLVLASRPSQDPTVGFRFAPEGAWVERLSNETDNFRAAFSWSLDHDVRIGVELAIWLANPWEQTGQIGELADWLDQALPIAGSIDVVTRAWGLRTHAWALANNNKQQSRGAEAAAESLRLFRLDGNQLGEADALGALAYVRWLQGDIQESVGLQEHALARYREIGDRLGIAHSLHVLAENCRDMGEFTRALIMLEESLKIAEEHGHRYWVCNSTHSLGDLALDQRHLQEAAHRYRQALAVAVELANQRNQAYCLAGLASVSALGGDAGEAGRLWAAVESFEDNAGARLVAAERRRYEKALASVEHDPLFQAGKESSSSTSLDEMASSLLVDE
jgi:non-specific serine/threonine protein kinase